MKSLEQVLLDIATTRLDKKTAENAALKAEIRRLEGLLMDLDEYAYCERCGKFNHADDMDIIEPDDDAYICGECSEDEQNNEAFKVLLGE